MRISDWSSDVCSSDLPPPLCRSRESGGNFATRGLHDRRTAARGVCLSEESWLSGRKRRTRNAKCRQRYRGFESLTLLHFLISTHPRSEEHTSELQSIMRLSYYVFCLIKKTNTKKHLRSH